MSGMPPGADGNELDDGQNDDDGGQEGYQEMDGANNGANAIDLNKMELLD